jgi:hypothetical protein
MVGFPHRGPAPARKRSARRLTLGTALFLASTLAACGPRTVSRPEAGYERGAVPDVAGTQVIVLPLQIGADEYPDLDHEIEYAFGDVGADVAWVFPAELRAALSRNPGMDLSVDNLPVRDFLLGELRRVGDPLFGDLYRLGVLMQASYVLIPVEAHANRGGQGVSLELTAALVEARSGYVRWFGVVEGGEGAPGDVYVSATAADALARRVAR